jgi:pyruvate/2-oxoglutarate dehydrogenase complex dihydrolipoamide dehydrogenase (E3) component
MLTVCFYLRRSVIVGAGYIAVEIAGILSALGSKTSLMIRHDKVSPVLSSSLSLTFLFLVKRKSFFLHCY